MRQRWFWINWDMDHSFMDLYHFARHGSPWEVDMFRVLRKSPEVRAEIVSGSYFNVLGVRPILGREFTDAELARPNVPPSAIILGHELWQRQFNGDPNVVGRTIRMSRMPAPLPVVGIMPPGIRFLPDLGASSEPNYDLNAHVDFWLGTAPDETRLTSGAGNTVARLTDGATIATAQAEVAALSAGVAAANPALQGISATVVPVQDALNRDGLRLLVPLFGSVALVFFIACANVAGLLVTRGIQRHSEFAMRSALGSTLPRGIDFMFRCG